MSSPELQLQAEVEAVGRISILSNLLDVVCRTTGMGFAAVARVTEERWVACSVKDDIAFGLKPGGELKVESTICHEIRQSHRAVIIDHVAEDPHFCGHHTPAMYGFQSYISIPIIRKDGTFFGTLCAIDPHPHKLNTPEIVGMFNLFADLISFHLSAAEQLAFAEERLTEERKIAELREQFIAILAHDLRNPVGAVLNSAQLLKRMQLDERGTRVANIVYDSAYRMRGLLENVLDFALGRMGGGINLNLATYADLEKSLLHVIEELQIIHPDRVIEKNIRLNHLVICDSKRISQLFSNLLGNALKHGKAGAPVTVIAESDENEFSLSVVNKGEKISKAVLERLFQPFSRGDIQPGQEGLGLGLYIASEIAKAHHGTLAIISANQEIRFTLTIPVAQSLVG